jgi:glycosyltransferase involved in cell wall biosynthesis
VTTPSISVIVPVFNGEAYLAEALRSVRAQAGWPLEIIVVDDGSSDGTPTVVRDWGGECLYRRQANAGPAAARNHGLALARGAFVGFLDADDLWPPAKLTRQMGALEARADLDGVFGTVQWLRPAAGGGGFVPDGAPTPGFTLAGGLFRRRVFERIGGFDPALRFSEDVDWFLRARERGATIVALDGVGLLYRRHPSSLTHGVPPEQLRLAEVFKRSLDRRRDAGVGAMARPIRGGSETGS